LLRDRHVEGQWDRSFFSAGNRDDSW